jgi:Icc protein
MRVVQLTDCHLSSDRSFALGGIPVWPRFLAVLKDIQARAERVDLMVLTGDVAHDGLASTYEAVANCLEPWRGRLWVLPGNHDNVSHLCDVFPAESPRRDGERVLFLRWGNWQLIGLDSVQPGEDWGRLGDEQLQWLHNLLERSPSNLAETPAHPHRLGSLGHAPTSAEPTGRAEAPSEQQASVAWTVLFMHHPPFSVRCSWLDSIGLADASSLSKLVESHSGIRLIVAGHVHQEACTRIGSAIALTSPAVGPQFRPRAPTVTLESTPARYRVLELEPDGHWFTQVWECSL